MAPYQAPAASAKRQANVVDQETKQHPLHARSLETGLRPSMAASPARRRCETCAAPHWNGVTLSLASCPAWTEPRSL